MARRQAAALLNAVRRHWHRAAVPSPAPQQFVGRNVLDTRSRPLLNPDNGMMVLWSPKSACTTVFVWFAGTIGKLDEVHAYGNAHRYRMQVYRKSDLYQRGLERSPADYRIVRVIRDPYQRAASIFRHALRTAFMNKQLKASPAALDRSTGFSFLQFLDYLGSLDLETANTHLRAQRHLVESEHWPEFIINISRQDLFTELNHVEEAFGLARTDFHEMAWLHERESERKARPGAFEGKTADDFPFDKDAASGLKPWPDYNELLTPRARARIEKIYARDFEAYAAHL